ncbi:hypothetical protein ACFZCP_11245 [Streptomyces sp. NPDC007971]|uniref:hypothetical protein n=1 Tax=Streptomyces sp. NPDC007971 TaxID=3364799 RepID=UPI0036E03A95
MIVAAADPWWADWPKFLPGWLAFAWTLGLGARKVWLRRHHLALGPAADGLRDALEASRTRFEDIISAGGRRADWFEDEGRRDTDRKIEDLAERLKDEKLRTALTGVVAAWRSAFGHAPPRRIIGGYMEDYPTPRQEGEQAADEQRFALQVQAAQAGQLDAQSAMRRLNELERRTVGRS